MTQWNLIGRDNNELNHRKQFKWNQHVRAQELQTSRVEHIWILMTDSVFLGLPSWQHIWSQCFCHECRTHLHMSHSGCDEEPSTPLPPCTDNCWAGDTYRNKGRKKISLRQQTLCEMVRCFLSVLKETGGFSTRPQLGSLQNLLHPSSLTNNPQI